MNERLTKELLALVDAFQAVRPLTDVTLSKYYGAAPSPSAG